MLSRGNLFLSINDIFCDNHASSAFGPSTVHEGLQVSRLALNRQLRYDTSVRDVYTVIDAIEGTVVYRLVTDTMVITGGIEDD